MLDPLQIGIRQSVARFRRDEQGAALVEYGMLVALIAAVCIGAVTILGNGINGVFVVVNGLLAAIPGF